MGTKVVEREVLHRSEEQGTVIRKIIEIVDEKTGEVLDTTYLWYCGDVLVHIS